MDCRLLRLGAITLPRLVLAMAIGLFGGNESSGELPEFRDVLMQGSISNPSGLAYWQFGDDDGDGIVDAGELEAPPMPIRSTLSTISSTYQNAPNGEFPDFYDFSSPASFSRLGSALGASTYQSRPLFVQIGGVEVMQTLRFKTDLAEGEREEGSEPTDSVDLAIGVRFFDFSTADPFMINGLAAMSVSTVVSNQISGPQASVSWNRQLGRWRMTAANSMMLGYCDIEGSQSVNVASSIIPRRLNQPALLRSSSASHSLEANDIAPLAELRLRASYDVASSTALFVGYDLLYLGALRTPIDSITWSLPSMGLQDRGGDDLSVSTLSMGIEWTR